MAGGRCPPDPPVFGWGGKAPPDPPLNGRSSHLIEAAKRGRLDQMLFFSVPLTTRAPPTSVRRPSDNRPRYQRSYGTFFFCLKRATNLKSSATNVRDVHTCRHRRTNRHIGSHSKAAAAQTENRLGTNGNRSQHPRRPDDEVTGRQPKR